MFVIQPMTGDHQADDHQDSIRNLTAQTSHMVGKEQHLLPWWGLVHFYQPMYSPVYFVTHWLNSLLTYSHLLLMMLLVVKLFMTLVCFHRMLYHDLSTSCSRTQAWFWPKLIHTNTIQWDVSSQKLTPNIYNGAIAEPDFKCKRRTTHSLSPDMTSGF